MRLIYPILMVGGAGTRLWPVSRKSMPKQFQTLITSKSLFQETVSRVTGTYHDIQFAPPIIMGAAHYKDIIEAQLDEIGIEPTAIILEPCPRSTTPVAAVCSQIISQIDNGLALLLPSDHHIADVDTFRAAIAEAMPTAQQEWITTFGITPTRPETGFGYIKAGEKIEARTNKVASFTEKPDLERAKIYQSSNEYFWNAGIFLFAPNRMLTELQELAPGILHHATQSLSNASRQAQVIHLEEVSFSKCDNISLDYSVMEKTKHAALYNGLECGWSDVGNWQAISELKPSITSKDIISLENSNCHMQTDGSLTIAALGLSDLVIVVHDGAVLVMHKDRAQNVQDVISELKARGQDTLL